MPAAGFGIGAPAPRAMIGAGIRGGSSAMAEVVFWEKPGCGGNARQKARLRSCGHTVIERSLLAEPWTADRLGDFLAGLPVADWFNRAAPKVKSGEVVPEALDGAAALALMLAEPLLIRRPLMEAAGRRVVGFDEAVVDAWIGLTPSDRPVGEGCPKGGEPHPPCPTPITA